MWANEISRVQHVIAMLLQAGADVGARDKNGMTPLMYAARNTCNPVDMICVLLEAGADARAKDNEGKTALEHSQDNEKLRRTDAYGKLQEALK